MRRTLKTTLAIVASAAAFSLAGAGDAHASAVVRGTAPVAPGYFEMTDNSRKTFVVELTDAADIEHARELLAGRTDERPHIIGMIVKRHAGYNPMWGYHLDPDTVRFFDVAIEACDSTIPYAQANLRLAGGHFLPALYWCDWSSRLVREIPGR